jgi:hypothetical protein
MRRRGGDAMSRANAAVKKTTEEEEKETFRVKVLRLLDKLKNGISIKYDNADVELLLDLMEDYDVMAKRVNNSIIITLFSRYAVCTIRARIDKDGEWKVRSVVCRGRR